MSRIEDLLTDELQKLSEVRTRFAQRYGRGYSILSATGPSGQPVAVHINTGMMEIVAADPRALPVGYKMPEVDPVDREHIARKLTEERRRFLREEERCVHRIRSLAQAVISELDLTEWGLE